MCKSKELGVGMNEKDEKDYFEICKVDKKVLELEREITTLLKSVEDKRKALREKKIWV